VRAAFFDLDKTVIAKSSLVAFGPEVHARGLLHRRTLIWGVLSQTIFMRFGADEENTREDSPNRVIADHQGLGSLGGEEAGRRDDQ